MGSMRALIVMGVQLDLLPGGKFEIPDSDGIVEEVSTLINKEFRDPKTGIVFAVQDWHPANHKSFESEGGPFPSHCVMGTNGAILPPNLHNLVDERYALGWRPDMETLSGLDAFNVDGNTLYETLLEWDVNEVNVCGMTLERGVRATALASARRGWKTRVYSGASRCIDRSNYESVTKQMRDADITVNVSNMRVTT